VRRIKATRRAMLAFLAGLPEDAVRRPRALGSWSVQDVLAHLVSCDEETVRRFGLIARGRADRIHWFESIADGDRFNARSVARLRRVRLPTLRRRFERAGAAVVTRLESLPIEALRDPSHAYTVVDWLPAPGWTHVQDHLAEIKGWWRRQRPARRRTIAPGPARSPA
jgi:uncharacterized damage-inducible protein DinB